MPRRYKLGPSLNLPPKPPVDPGGGVKADVVPEYAWDAEAYVFTVTPKPYDAPSSIAADQIFIFAIPDGSPEYDADALVASDLTYSSLALNTDPAGSEAVVVPLPEPASDAAHIGRVVWSFPE